MFLVTLAGCEFDLLGFAMSFQEYWNINSVFQIILRILLISQPVMYLLVAFAYQCNSGEQDGDLCEEKQPKKRSPLEWATQQRVSLYFYHWMPFIRFYLVMKPLDPNDIEGVFMSNTLSSFTLGSVQMIGIMASWIGLQHTNPEAVFSDLPFTVQMNFGTWLVNWTITVVYFLTPIAQKMKNIEAVTAVKYNSNHDYQQGVCELHAAVRQDAEDGNGESPHYNKFKDMLVEELSLWTETDVAGGGSSDHASTDDNKATDSKVDDVDVMVDGNLADCSIGNPGVFSKNLDLNMGKLAMMRACGDFRKKKRKMIAQIQEDIEQGEQANLIDLDQFTALDLLGLRRDLHQHLAAILASV